MLWSPIVLIDCVGGGITWSTTWPGRGATGASLVWPALFICKTSSGPDRRGIMIVQSVQRMKYHTVWYWEDSEIRARPHLRLTFEAYLPFSEHIEYRYCTLRVPTYLPLPESTVSRYRYCSCKWEIGIWNTFGLVNLNLFQIGTYFFNAIMKSTVPCTVLVPMKVLAWKMAMMTASKLWHQGAQLFLPAAPSWQLPCRPSPQTGATWWSGSGRTGPTGGLNYFPFFSLSWPA